MAQTDVELTKRKISYAIQSKQLTKNSIVGKGVPVSAAVPFRQYPDKINAIQQSVGGATSSALLPFGAAGLIVLSVPQGIFIVDTTEVLKCTIDSFVEVE